MSLIPAPIFIHELKPGEIFVYGSNEAGKHGRGAARQALNWGAKYGQGIGLAGQTYGIPTKDANIRTLPLERIDEHIERFLIFAQTMKQYKFLCSNVGCGLAGYNASDIAPMFAWALTLPNVFLPQAFIDVIKP